MSRWLCLGMALLALASLSLSAVEIEVAGPEDSIDKPLPAGAPQPGREEVDHAAPVGAYRIDWDTYVSVIVVGEGSGAVRPAWVLTYDKDASKGLAVAYSGRAFVDHNGIVHIDARDNVDNGMPGALGHRWSADSFAIVPDGQVFTLDNRASANGGKLLETIDPKQAAEQFRKLLLLAQAVVSGLI